MKKLKKGKVIVSNECISDNDDDNDPVHNRLLTNVKELHGKKKILRATRTEPSSEISLLHLGKQRKRNSEESQEPLICMNDVLNDLKHTPLNEIQKLRVLQKKHKPIPVPLEKVHAKKIEREVTFDNVKKTLNKWKNVIESNRTADQLKFPIGEDNINTYNDHSKEEDFLSTFRQQTPLEKKMAQLLNSSEVAKEEKELEQNDFHLTLGELIQRRKMFAKIRAQASYKVAKAWRQNKIKSKSYHRLLRRERVKQQMKDFDTLKEKNPEAAFKQLELIDKARAKERATLRHRNTGHWAKNQIIRSKYNKQSKVALSEQIMKNRELTKKRKIVYSDSENDMELGDEDKNISKNKSCEGIQNEYEKFISGYQNYQKAVVNKKDENQAVVAADICNEKNRKQSKENEENSTDLSSDYIGTFHDDKTNSLLNDNNINDKDTSDSEDELNIRRIDETVLLDEQVSSFSETSVVNRKGNMLADENIKIVYDRNVDINPDNFLSLCPESQLQTGIPNSGENEDGLDDEKENGDAMRHMIISEAFASDELVSEFQKEKQKVVEDSLPKDIDLSLPGWGSWTGSKIEKKEKRKPRVNKRLLFRIPAAPPRKDCNKGRVIIREEKDSKLREHMVNELPYPFTSVKGFESSIRTPVGREWVPETVHQNLIAPVVKTRLGAIIEPMDVGVLVTRDHVKG